MARVALPEDIYGGGPQNHLLRSWLAAEISREKAEYSLKHPQMARPGSYIVRRSQTSKGHYAVTVVEANNTITSYKISDLGCGQVGLRNGHAFATLEHLLEHFYDNPFPENKHPHVALKLMHPVLLEPASAPTPSTGSMGTARGAAALPSRPPPSVGGGRASQEPLTPPPPPAAGVSSHQLASEAPPPLPGNHPSLRKGTQMSDYDEFTCRRGSNDGYGQETAPPTASEYELEMDQPPVVTRNLAQQNTDDDYDNQPSTGAAPPLPLRTVASEAPPPLPGRNPR
eukprot:m.488461 g.488461  ORF g.488461 m.488461 type:complete len:284 (+) comp25799_c0_seq1:79-930(+)